ncbi:MAG: hypothetical protein IJK84_05970 [Bacteroidales bacterium]|nr:hypothetical protein [Bacteroidales bacterium]
MRSARHILLFFSLLLVVFAAKGQVSISSIANLPSSNPISNSNRPLPDSTANPNADTLSADGLLGGIEYHEDIPDSILQASIFIFQRQPMQVKIMELQHPNLTPTGTQYCDPIDALNGNYYLNVSELGHPHYALFPLFEGPPGLAYRPNIFPTYYKTPDNIWFYQVQKPYSVLAYHSSLNKDYQLHVTHTQNINDHWNFALDYHLFSPTGAFANSSATDHLVDLSSNYYSPDARYQITAGIISQKFVLGENGGLSNMEAFVNKRTSNMSGIPVNETRRMSLTSDFTFFIRQSFNTVRQVQWYRPIKKQVTDTIIKYDTLRLDLYDSIAKDTLHRDSIISTTSYLQRDTIIGYDTLLPSNPHVYNTGVFALDFQWDRQKYRYADSSLYNQFSALLYWTNDAYPDHRWRNPLKLYGGIRPQVSLLQLDPTIFASSTLSEFALYPFARLEMSPWKGTLLNLLAEATPNISDYNLDAQLSFPLLDSMGNPQRSLTLRAVVKACGPELIYTAQNLRNDYYNPTEILPVSTRKIELNYHQADLLDIHLAAQHVSHNIWLEQRTLDDGTTLLIPCQPDGNALLLQGRINLYLTPIRWLHYDMQQIVQYSSDQDLVRVPLFASKNSIYTDFYLFGRVLHTQIGVDLRYHTLFKADTYDPTLGVFFRQNDTDVGNYLWADFFVNLQIKRASIYAKAGHLNSYLEQQAHCIIPGYPSKQFGLYFGLTWKFFD